MLFCWCVFLFVWLVGCFFLYHLSEVLHWLSSTSWGQSWWAVFLSLISVSHRLSWMKLLSKGIAEVQISHSPPVIDFSYFFSIKPVLYCTTQMAKNWCSPPIIHPGNTAPQFTLCRACLMLKNAVLHILLVLLSWWFELCAPVTYLCSPIKPRAWKSGKSS